MQIKRGKSVVLLYLKIKRKTIKLFFKFAKMSLLFLCVNESVGLADLIPEPNLFDVNSLRNYRFRTMFFAPSKKLVQKT